MQSRNPVFNRAEGFNGRSAGAATFPGHHDQYGAGQYGAGGAYGAPTTTGTDRMTIDTVVQKTAVTLGVLIVAAAATWYLTPDITSQQAASTLYTVSIVGALGGFALSMVNSFKKVVSPPLVLLYAALQGLFVGAFSKTVTTIFGNPDDGVFGSIVMGAVLGTMAAVAGTLAAYKFFDIKVGTKFRKWVVGMMFGFVAVSLLDFVLGFFHADFGFNGFGTMGFISSIIGLGLGVLMLILDFDFVERGIAAGLPERESWRAAFGLTVTIVWIYIELLRILAILRGND
ncbi:MAG TPA: Bax inhibitor-1/YccA family protein [Marmoricola sp.]|jgi:uncharacterized YccA/Bax inhibitor family protein|nr:Bax inhibitor-1/YccA family protein [Marmoricola sp.]